ncbi:ABC transporter ATP-binding protein [Corynebacterium freneyi]|uniref:ATP-binding cassette domain-containing protein n=1 Tax=Corynebacterium freneyi TaxID=134034 RepID=UPI001EF165B0|nr:ABC transporter ATP-binding protein [Corynebacterium freneyi]MCG7439832.1 ABC transporter ATP-binding protein/permease [Corynebacterium freneyi]
MKDVMWLLRFARPASGALAASVAARIVGHVLGAAVLAVPAWTIGAIAVGRLDSPGRAAVVAVAAVAVMALVKAVSRYAEQFLGHYAAFRLMGEMQVWVIDRLIPRSPAIGDRLGAARLHALAVRDVDRVEVFFAHTIAPAVTAVAVPGAAVAAAWRLAGPWPAAALVLVFAAGFAVALAGARASRGAAAGTARTRSDIAAHASDTVRLRGEILAHGAVGFRLADAARLDANLARQSRSAGRRAGIRHGANGLRVWVGMGAVLAAGLPGLASGSGMAGLPGLLAAMTLVAGTAASFDTIERLAGSLPAGLESTRRIRRLAAGAPEVAEPEKPVPLPVAADGAADARANVGGSADLDAVTFRYPDAPEPALADADLHVPPGSLIGVAGATGSGKSTVAKLIQRHWDPAHGRVRVHGVDAREAGSAAVHRVVAVADQDPFLLNAGVADNLRLGAPDADDELVARAMWIADLDAGEVGTRRIGRRGERLSGGQRQRLALARAYLRAATAPGGPRGAVLVLDEATSHQDPLTQQRIVERLRGAGVTLVVIAHRLEVLSDADAIVVIDRGRIVERGTWAELIDRGGHFAAMWHNRGS